MSDRPTVTTEGANLSEAIAAAAAQLSVDPSQVQYKLDAEHFRNQYGAMTGANTVKISAWTPDPAEFAGGEAGRVWLAELVGKMNIDASVRMRIRPDHNADLRMDSEKARFLVGKQGRTLNAIRMLLAESIGREYPDWTYHLDVVGGERDRDEGRGRDRDDHRGRDRDDRRGRGRDDRRGDRRDGRRDDNRGGRGRERSDADMEALTRLGQKVAQHVLETGESEIIRKRLNSFERRAIHIAVKEMDGVGSKSVEHEDEKRIEIYPLDASASASE